MKISAIVPVYNSEKYIRNCIQSILSQTYQDWQLILVDDGSTDRSLEILKEYEDKDIRIVAIHKENAGPGAARNTGIKRAEGEYIVFVDSDDRIRPDYFEKIAKETADIVFIDIEQVDEKNKVLSKEYLSEYKRLSKDEFIRGQMTGRILWGGVRKAVKASLLRENNIFFSNHKVGEEAIYSFLIMHYAKRYSFLMGTVYEYVNREGSQSKAGDDDPWGDVAKALKNQVIDLGLYNQYANTINAFIETAAVVSLNRMISRYNFYEYKAKAKARLDEYNKELDRQYSIDINSMPSKARILHPLIRRKLITLIYIAGKAQMVRNKK